MKLKDAGFNHLAGSILVPGRDPMIPIDLGIGHINADLNPVVPAGKCFRMVAQAAVDVANFANRLEHQKMVAGWTFGLLQVVKRRGCFGHKQDLSYAKWALVIRL